MRCTSLVAFGFLVACGLAAPVARANGRFPVASQLVFDPSDPSVMAVRATIGVLVSRDTGKTWDWICEKAMGYGAVVEDPAIAITAGAGLVVGTREGLARSGDGCNWTFPSIGAPVVDVVVRRDDPRGAIALVAEKGAFDDAGNATYLNQLYATTDSGATWSPLGLPLDPLLELQTVEVAKTDPSRIYVSGTRHRSDGADAVILTSRDGGAQFTERSFPLSTGEIAPFVAAVDPANADRVYVRVQSFGGSTRLVVSDDGAATFHDSFKTKGPMLGFALSEDGAKVFLGGLDDGLLAASRADLVFTQRSMTKVLCLATRGAVLYACSNERSDSGFAIGASADDGAKFTSVMQLACIRGAVVCGGDASAASCAADFPAIQQTLGACGPAPSDSGAGDASTSDGGARDAEAAGEDAGGGSLPGAPPDAGGGSIEDDGSTGGGCTTSSAPGSLTAAATMVFALLGLRRRRRS